MALIVLVMVLGLVSALPAEVIAGVVWPPLLINLPGVGLWGRGKPGPVPVQR